MRPKRAFVFQLPMDTMQIAIRFIAALTLALPHVTAAQSGLARSDTTIRSFDGRSLSGEVIRLTVPENRQNPTNLISVGALRFRSSSASPGNPIVFLMGGPGIPGSVMVPIPPYFTLFERLREIGDVIVVDQRGIGLSSPHLDCPMNASLADNAFVDTKVIVDAIRSEVARCAAEWRAKGVNPASFNTLESADDIDALRKALNIRKLDVVAFSYGTRLALAMTARHESSIGRIVLQGVNGPGLVIKRPVAIERKLSRIMNIIAKDTSWATRPDLVAAARAARRRLDAKPAIVSILNRKAGNRFDVAVGRAGFDAIASLNLDDPRLPALLVSVASGDDRILSKFVESAWNGLSAGSVGLMARAVNCAADRPVSRWPLVETESRLAPFGMPFDNEFLKDDFCQATGVPATTVEFSRPLQSSVPALLVTGALDATNPIENARDVTRGLSRATIVEVQNAAHEALTTDAVQSLLVDFLSGKDVSAAMPATAEPHYLTVTEAARR